MKIVHLTTSNKGGAGIAALRLHEALLENGVHSELLSMYQFPSEVPKQYLFREQDCSAFPALVYVKLFFLKVFRKLGLYQSVKDKYSKKYLSNRPKGFEYFSFPFSDFDISKHPIIKSANIVHLHWVSDGFVDYQRFFKNFDKKIVWTLHDMNPFTGGCHHADGCMKFESSCSNCPQLKGTFNENFAEEILQTKLSAFSNIKNSQALVVAPSDWLTNLSKRSNLFKRFMHQTIRNVVNDKVFKAYNKQQARQELKLPLDKKIILFVSHDISNTRKGIDLLSKALANFKNNESIIVCSVGSETVGLDLPMVHIKMGYVSDETVMAKLYSAADVFVLPSIAENFPNTICESLLCGTPVVGFNVGGIPELINDYNGVLVAPFDVNKLYEAIEYSILNPSKFDLRAISEDAKGRFSRDRVVTEYMELYKELMN